ncbi:HRDC domain-containing protein [Dermabacteraceae bacterium P13088]
MTVTQRRTRERNRDRALRPVKVKEPGLPRMDEPRGGIPEVVDRLQPLLAWCQKTETGNGPIAVDSERASSFRYSSRAYLIQLHSREAGTLLIDPLAFAMPPSLKRVLSGREWVLHSASADLPCLAELDLVPDAIFDTELAARLLGMERVGLGSVVEDTLGVKLAKEHSAADWSTRPLPKPWLAYAALDVDVLLDVRDILQQRLVDAGKSEWASQEFSYVRLNSEPRKRSEPWRSLHGLGKLRAARQLALARELWQLRDSIAREEDLSPHLVLRDRTIVALSLAQPKDRSSFQRIAQVKGEYKDRFWRAAQAAYALPQSHLPATKDPDASKFGRHAIRRSSDSAQRLQELRDALSVTAKENSLPLENLLTPSFLRRFVHEHPGQVSAAQAAQALTSYGARSWQVALSAPVIAATPLVRA